MIITLAFTAGFENLEVRQAADQPTAEAHVAVLPDDRTAFVFDTDRPDWLGDQLHDRYSCAQLPQLFNAVRDPSVPPVNKFEDKPTALRRLAAQLLLRARATSPLTPPQPRQEQPKMSDTPKRRGRVAEPKPANSAKFKAGRVRAGTARARVLELMDGAHTPADVDAALGFTKAGYSLAHFHCLWRDCGVGYAFDEAGHVTALYPEGESLATALAAPVA